MEKYSDELIRLNPWWIETTAFKALYPRSIYTEQLLRHPHHIIDILIGARRVGKTYLLKDCIRQLLGKHNPRSILYITAELPILAKANLSELIEAFKKTSPESNQRFIFIDEIQELEDWQTTLKYYADTDSIKFFVTGSSSLILNQQTSKLTGRYLTTHVFPLNYQEFLSFKSLSTQTKWIESADTALAYLELGGYPDHVLRPDPQLLAETTQSILYRDLLSLHGIRNPALLKTVLQLLCDKITTPLSSTTIAKDLKIDPQTAASYLKYLQDVYLVYPLYRKGRSHRIVKGSTPKFYINDTGILKLFSQTSRIGHLAENAVFLHLYQQSTRGLNEVFYDIDEDQEVDFVINDKKYDVKFKPIENPHNNVTYIVPKIDPYSEAKQISIDRFLSSFILVEVV